MTTIRVNKYYNEEGILRFAVYYNGRCTHVLDQEEKAIFMAREMEERAKAKLPDPEDILVINID